MTRVNNLARELGASNQEIMKAAEKLLGHPVSHSSRLSQGVEGAIRCEWEKKPLTVAREIPSQPPPPSPFRMLAKRSRKFGPLGPRPESAKEQRHTIAFNERMAKVKQNADVWKVGLSEKDIRHLGEPSRRLLVQCRRGIQATLQWPAAYIKENRWYFTGKTFPIALRPMSRGGNFILGPPATSPRAIVIRWQWQGEKFEVSFAFASAATGGLEKLAESAWVKCPNFKILKDRFDPGI